MTYRPEQHGFTLLEVLIALVVIAIAMTAAFQVVSSSSRSQLKLQDTTFARWVAETEMANIQLGLTPPAVGKTAGESPMAGRIWHWQRQITVAADPALRRAQITVRSENSSNPSASLVAFVLAPNQQ